MGWPRGATATISAVNASGSSVVLLPENLNRHGFSVFNDDTGTLYIALAATSSTSAFTVRLAPSDLYEVPQQSGYTGVVSGIWTAPGSGAARITEWP